MLEVINLFTLYDFVSYSHIKKYISVDAIAPQKVDDHILRKASECTI